MEEIEKFKSGSDESKFKNNNSNSRKSTFLLTMLGSLSKDNKR